jgi:hypothetical protein
MYCNYRPRMTIRVQRSDIAEGIEPEPSADAHGLGPRGALNRLTRRHASAANRLQMKPVCYCLCGHLESSQIQPIVLIELQPATTYLR